jgi:DNA-binding MarR family transcriptional regulator
MAQPSPPETAAALELWLTILNTFFRLRHSIRPVFAAHDLTGSQWRVFRTLGEVGGEGLTPGQISEELRVTPGNTTGIVDKLEEAGFTERVPHPDDRRAILVRLTAKGDAVYRQVRPAFDQRVAELLSGLSTAEKREMTAALRRVLEHAERVAPEDAGGPGEKGAEPRPR